MLNKITKSTDNSEIHYIQFGLKQNLFQNCLKSKILLETHLKTLDFQFDLIYFQLLFEVSRILKMHVSFH